MSKQRRCASDNVDRTAGADPEGFKKGGGGAYVEFWAVVASTNYTFIHRCICIHKL